jgi:hypothetical protein
MQEPIMQNQSLVVWAAIEDCDGPVTLSNFEAPFMLYPQKDGAGFRVQGQMRFREDGPQKAVQIRLSRDDAMQLLAALDAYRQEQEWPIPRGALLRPQ